MSRMPHTDGEKEDGRRQRKRNSSLAWRLTWMALGAFGFGFALVPLYSVVCKVTGFGDRRQLAQAATVIEAPVNDRNVTVEFVSAAPTFGDWEFRPEANAMQVHPGKLYAAKFFARNLRQQPVTAQAVPSIAPSQAIAYFHKTECFCFSPQHFEGGEGRELTVRFIVAADLPESLDRLTLGYSMFTVPTTSAHK
jgi:cytochrome c oxidase assembly protein subunit 11